MKIACIGGGPAGLYLGILVKRSAPEHDVVVYERNRPTDTFGFGVVFSDATLGHLAAADPESHRQITDRFARWDDIEIQTAGETLRSTGHGFCGLERRTLLEILQRRARELGVRLQFEHAIGSLEEVEDADLVIGADGVSSWVRDALASELEPTIDVRPNKFVWLGCTVPYRAFTFIFKTTPHGLFRVHAYRYHADGSTFIVECRDDTWHSAGLADADEDRTLEILGEVFADELRGHRLIKNRSIWRSFPTVRCARWHARNVVLLGDAAHTAHFSIGSGTKLAMEDAIVLRDEVLAAPTDIPSALATYERRRRPEVEALQAAAQASLEWFEGTERYMRMSPIQLTYSLMTRSLRVSHASVAKRDPDLARGVERLLAARVGITSEAPPPPTALPMPLGDRRAPSRLAVAPVVGTRAPTDDDLLVALGGAAAAGAGLVVTPAIAPSGFATDERAVAWTRIVDYVHAKRSLIVARLAVAEIDDAADLSLRQAIERIGYAGFDLLLLDAIDAHEDEPAPPEALPAIVAAARSSWRARSWLAARVHARAGGTAAAVAHAAQLVRAGAGLLWVTAASSPRGDGQARLPAAPLADRLRLELGVATCVDGNEALLPDLDAAVAAGRADLVTVERLPSGARRTS